LDRGYQLAWGSVVDHVGKFWELLDPEARQSLVLLEISAEKHRALHAPQRLYLCELQRDYTVVDAHVRAVDALEREGDVTWGAYADSGMARLFGTEELHPTAGAAVAAQRELIVSECNRLRASANALEMFLSKMESL
jgi:hypothetical protein